MRNTNKTNKPKMIIIALIAISLIVWVGYTLEQNKSIAEAKESLGLAQMELQEAEDRIGVAEAPKKLLDRLSSKRLELKEEMTILLVEYNMNQKRLSGEVETIEKQIRCQRKYVTGLEDENCINEDAYNKYNYVELGLQ